MKIEWALEPSDILWTNYGYEKWEKILTWTFTTVISFVIMGITYIIIVLIKNYQLNNLDTSFASLILSLIITVFIALINVSLWFIIWKLVQFERRTSYSVWENVIVKWIGISYFITNGLLILLTFRLVKSSWSLWE